MVRADMGHPTLHYIAISRVDACHKDDVGNRISEHCISKWTQFEYFVGAAVLCCEAVLAMLGYGLDGLCCVSLFAWSDALREKEG